VRFFVTTHFRVEKHNHAFYYSVASSVGCRYVYFLVFHVEFYVSVVFFFLLCPEAADVSNTIAPLLCPHWVFRQEILTNPQCSPPNICAFMASVQPTLLEPLGFAVSLTSLHIFGLALF
jgi:hypothetical protein